jgi:AbrB family looped-hinge helix DNA binding protein
MIHYPRLLEGMLEAETSVAKVRLLFGARQTGKFTLLQRLADADARVFDLQERRTRLELERNPHALTQMGLLSLLRVERNVVSLSGRQQRKIPFLTGMNSFLSVHTSEAMKMKAKVAERGQVTIPKALRLRLGIRPGTVLEFSEEKGRLVVTKAEAVHPVDEFYGSLGRGRNTKEIMAVLRGPA